MSHFPFSTSGSQTQDIKIGWRDTMQSGMQTIRLREVLRFYDLNDADRATLCLILGRSLLDLLQSTWANTHKYLTRIAIQDQSRAVVNARMKYPQRIVQQSPSPLIHLQVMKRIFYNLMGHHSGTWKMGEYKAGNGL